MANSGSVGHVLCSQVHGPADSRGSHGPAAACQLSHFQHVFRRPLRDLWR